MRLAALAMRTTRSSRPKQFVQVQEIHFCGTTCKLGISAIGTGARQSTGSVLYFMCSLSLGRPDVIPLLFQRPVRMHCSRDVVGRTAATDSRKGLGYVTSLWLGFSHCGDPVSCLANGYGESAF